MPEILPFPAEEKFEKLAPNVHVRKLRDTPEPRKRMEKLRREMAMCELPCDV